MKQGIKQQLGQFYLYSLIIKNYQRYKVRRELRRAPTLKIILGAATTHFDGWISTDIRLLDITLQSDWDILFKENSIDRLLAEHVFEHLSESQCYAALKIAHQYLKPNGTIRIAVPDGNRRDAAYVAEVLPPRHGHKMLFRIDNLVTLLEVAGFKAEPLEYFDAEEVFHHSAWSQDDGFVQRSFRFDTQVDFRRGEFFYTSLIVDGRKL
jgi:predicted SAM-dependent methyltransferase